MSISVQVLYPTDGGTAFDHDYYRDTHMPLVNDHWGKHLTSASATKGVAGGPDTPPAYHAIATLIFADQAAMQAAMADSKPIMGDIANFYDSRPVVLIGEVVA